MGVISDATINLEVRCNLCHEYAAFLVHDMEYNMDEVSNLIDRYHSFGHDKALMLPVEPKKLEWKIQQVPDMETPFLLHKGVVVGRLYGGCPIKEMLEKLNA